MPCWPRSPQRSATTSRARRSSPGRMGSRRFGRSSRARGGSCGREAFSPSRSARRRVATRWPSFAAPRRMPARWLTMTPRSTGIMLARTASSWRGVGGTDPMDAIVVRGGTPLRGRVEIAGSKNSVLPIMAATLLAEGTHVIENVPDLRDVRTMANLLVVLGSAVKREGSDLEITTGPGDGAEAPYDLVKTMRASIYVLGPLVARRGSARVSLPGGCAWGPRPVDL